MKIFLVLKDNSTLPDRFTNILSNHEIILYKASCFIKASRFINASRRELRNKRIKEADIFFLDFYLGDRKNKYMNKIFDEIVDVRIPSNTRTATINFYKKRTLEEILIEFANCILEENGEIRCIPTEKFMKSFTIHTFSLESGCYLLPKKRYPIFSIIIILFCFASLGLNLTFPLISHEHLYTGFINFSLIILTFIFCYTVYKFELFD